MAQILDTTVQFTDSFLIPQSHRYSIAGDQPGAHLDLQLLGHLKLHAQPCPSAHPSPLPQRWLAPEAGLPTARKRVELIPLPKQPMHLPEAARGNDEGMRRFECRESTPGGLWEGRVSGMEDGEGLGQSMAKDEKEVASTCFY